MQGVRCRAFRGVGLALLGLAAVIGAHEARAGGPPRSYVVDTTSDANLTACSFDPGDCSLRGAINAANAHAAFSADSITFSIPPGGVQTITPASELPPITDAVVIDATGQPGTGGPCIDELLMPCIRVDGVNAGALKTGLTISAAGVTVRGLAIYRFSTGISAVGASYTVIRRNYLGTPDGSALAPAGANGIVIAAGSDNTTIGGSSNGDGNLIAGYTDSGVAISEVNSPTVQGNSIGMPGLPNKSGISMTWVSGALIGGNDSGESNHIPYNTEDGIAILDTDANETNVIAGNVITHNGAAGVRVHASSNVRIGGSDATSPGGACTGECNLVSGNGGDGVAVEDGSSSVAIQGNFIGVGLEGVAAVGNASAGIRVEGSTTVTIGGTVAPARNVISGNDGLGVAIAEAADIAVAGSFIGINTTGSAAVPNAGGGIGTYNVSSSTIGGGEPEARNVISGNEGFGVAFYGNASGNRIEGNYIGLSAPGTAAIPNWGGGVTLTPDTPPDSQTGFIIDQNVISGNDENGIEISTRPGTTSTGSSIYGNIIGLDASGASPIPNALDGIHADSSAGGDIAFNLIGTGVAGDKPNVISGNAGDGVELTGSGTHGNHIVGAQIGVSAGGDEPAGNGGYGVSIFDGAQENTVQQSTIGANAAGGVSIQDGAGGTALYLNHIGTNDSLATGLGNGGDGVHIDGGHANVIGFEPGPGIAGIITGGNVIRHNSGAGVLVAGVLSASNLISGNSIDDNLELGIDLESGANNGLPPPALAGATGDAGGTQVSGTLTGLLPGATYTVEAFASPECDPSGDGEGREFLAVGEITIGPAGTGDIDIALPSNLGGLGITTTVTDGLANTSEFSNCIAAEGSPPTPTPMPTPTPTPTPTSTPTPTAAASPTEPPAGLTQGDVQCDDDVDSVDALQELRHVAGLNVFQEPGCPAIGSQVASQWGDVDCDGDVDAVDALKVLRHVAALDVSQDEPCTDIGQPL